MLHQITLPPSYPVNLLLETMGLQKYDSILLYKTVGTCLNAYNIFFQLVHFFSVVLDIQVVDLHKHLHQILHE